MGLRGKLNTAILGVFALMAVGVAIATVVWVDRTVVSQATERVALNISSGWLTYDHERERVRRVAELLAHEADWASAMRGELYEQLEAYRDRWGLDVLIFLDAEGAVVMRGSAPNSTGDLLADDPLVRAAMAAGTPSEGTILLPGERLDREGRALRSRCEEHGGEPLGMMVGAVAPVWSGQGITGYVQAGVLLNGDTDYVDRVRDLVFEDRFYAGKPLGTATIFMGDLRITTNVRDESGRRAIGTRVSDEVAQQVLHRGQSWTGRAWVVDAWYLSQYDPIRDPDGRVIGMLYIGELEEKYDDIRREAVTTYLLIIVIGMSVAFAIFYGIGKGILRPVQQLSEATVRLAEGDLDYQLQSASRDEVGSLARSFDRMARQLREQRQEIEAHRQTLMATNEELEETNRNYMEMLAFVSHELRNPLASSIMTLETVTKGYLGELTEQQAEALGRLDRNLHYFLGMIGEYLDLSRLERGEMVVSPENLMVRDEVIAPALDSLAAGFEGQRMQVDNRVPDDLAINVDRSLMRVVFDNLLANAIKYGREEGAVTLDAAVGEDEVTLWVQNEGEGIPADQIDKLFQKFGRLETHKLQGKKGTGLGLYVCRQIIAKHGGRIWAESAPGEWARFSLSLRR